MDYSGKRIHFMGAGGIGVSALAVIAKERGAVVTACDRAENEMTAYLRKCGITVLIGHDPAHLDGVDLLVHTAAVKPDHPERRAAVERGIATVKRGQFLADVLKGYKVIGVAGAHGKTTTTCLLGQILEKCGFDPTIVLGGVPAGEESNLRLGKSDIAVVELDESDASFLLPDVHIAVVTNIEPDHLDHYGSKEAVENAFVEFVGKVPADGKVVYCADDMGAVACCLGLPNTTSCGLSDCSDIKAVPVDVDSGEFLQAAQIFKKDSSEPCGKMLLKLPGIHNLKNAITAVGASVVAGAQLEQILSVMPSCKGVARRFETVGIKDDVIIIDDYAHHPTEVSAAIAAARSVHKGRVVAVFQPHLYSRTKFLQNEFCSALAAADLAVLVDIYPAREEPIEGVTSAVLVDGVRALGTKAEGPFAIAETAMELQPFIKEGDMVLFLGAGDIWKCAYEFAG